MNGKAYCDSAAAWTSSRFNARSEPMEVYMQAYQDGYANRTADMDEEFFLKIVIEWKHSWMNQYQNDQNDQKDYENYHRRAFGIDANMVHSLANRIVSAVNNKEKGVI